MLEEEKILEAFALLAGLEAEEAKQWAPLCRACGEELAGRLRADADLENERIYLAAAAEATYRRALTLHCGYGELNFSAPGLTVSANGKFAEEARRLRDDMLALCGDLLEDGMVFTAI